jgi:hypothetical protein
METKALAGSVHNAVPQPAGDMSDANSKPALTQRRSRGQLTWGGPLLLVVGRSALILGAQAVVACGLWLRSHAWSWDAAAKWWTVYGTLVDVGCLALMVVYTRREGVRLRDLIGPVRLRWGHDLFLAVGILCLVFPSFPLAALAANWLLYGGAQPPAFAGLAAGRVLPLWGMIYSFSVWWLIWSPTEEMTYQGYALSRLEVLFESRWKAIALVGFWWAIQHPFLPFILDRKYVAWRFIAFLPSTIILMLLYLKVRRLPPFILAHWPMDILAAFITLKL